MSGRAELRVRTGRPEEHQQLEELQRRASLANEQYREQLEAAPDAIVLPLRQLEDGAVIVAELGDSIAGFAALPVEEGHAELDGLFVEPALWGKGVGRVLVLEAVHRARRQGLALMVTASPSARAFYEKCGFVAEGDATTRFGPAIRMSN